MVTRRRLFTGIAALAAASVGKSALAALPEIVSSTATDTRTPLAPPNGRPYRPVATLNGWTLPWRHARRGQGISSGGRARGARNCARHEGQSLGLQRPIAGTHHRGRRGRPGAHVRHQPPAGGTSIHWHGQRLPNGMDGVSGLNQPSIKPGQTFVYEFRAQRAGTFMYHPHADETTQMAMGMMGSWVTHPADPGCDARRPRLRAPAQRL